MICIIIHMRKQWRLAFVYLMTQLTQFLICSFRISWRKWRGIKDVKTSSPSLIPRHSYSFTRHYRMLSTCMNTSTCMNIQHMHCEEFPPSSSVRGLHDGSTMRAQPMFNGVCHVYLPSNIAPSPTADVWKPSAPARARQSCPTEQQAV